MIRSGIGLVALLTTIAALIPDAGAKQYRYKPVPPDAPVSEDQARQYYRGCKKLSPPRFTDKALEYYCLCLADRVQKKLSQRDIYFLRNADSARMRKLALIKYVDSVITSCAAEPVGMIFEKRCMEERGTDPRVDKLGPTCQCLGERMREWTKINAGAIISRQLKRQPEEYRDNPLSALMEARRLLTGRTDQLLTCIRENQ